jgi:ABC-type multidrug transport system fused ATPase/permease subunit
MLAVIILNISTIVAGLTISFYYYWRVSLIVLGISPLILISASVNVTRMKGLAQQTDSAYK